MSDLVKRLRATIEHARKHLQECIGEDGCYYPESDCDALGLLDDAADDMTEAADELEDAINMLRPFARAAAGFESDEWSDDDALGYRELTVGHLRDAARVVAKYTKPGGDRT